jgi:hypothetical protein
MAALRSRTSLAALLCAALVAFSGCIGCRGGDQAAPETELYDAKPRRHVFAPPPGEVRAVPPHAIRSAGVGPYLLGATLEEILGILPHGPRVELLQIQGLLDYSLVRIEGDAIVIGVERFEGVTFVAVLDAEIARSEAGVGVGTAANELVAALGPAAEDPARLGDPRVLAFSSLPHAQFLVEAGEVVAVIVREGQDDEELAVGEPACADAERWDDVEIDVVAQAAPLPTPTRTPPQLHAGCFGGPRAQLVVVADERIAVFGGDPDAPRRRGSVSLDGLLHAAPIDVSGDGRDEVVTVSSRLQDDVLSIELVVFEVSEAGLTATDRHVAYELSSRWATWVGAELSDIELLIEARAREGVLEIGGLYVHRDRRGVRNVAPLKARTWAPELAQAHGVARPVGEDAGPAAELVEDASTERDVGEPPADAHD